MGFALVVVALVLPLAVVFRRAQTWVPPPAAGEAVVLRPELVILPAGSFRMGSPENEPGRGDDETLHRVRFENPLVVSRTEITQAQFRAVMDGDPQSADCEVVALGDDLPVSCVSWQQAVAFCNQLSEREGLQPVYQGEGAATTWQREANGYRLLTEAEWEYAARAGTQTRWVGTDVETEACRYANVGDRSALNKLREILGKDWQLFDCADGFESLSPVAALLPNAWHLYGLGGNVAEWVWDGHERDLAPGPTVDPSVDRGEVRVVRGGSWWSDPRSARIANRSRDQPSSRFDGLGFRVARSALPSEVLPSDPLR